MHRSFLSTAGLPRLVVKLGLHCKYTNKDKDKYQGAELELDGVAPLITDKWHMPCDMGDMTGGGGEPSLKISAP